MRFAIVSDLHANLQAWNAVLVDIRSNAIDKIVCLGDVVGYGPHPADVLQSAYASIDHFVLGNHDAVICGKLDPELFNSAAQDVIRWTQSRLSRDAMAFLSSQPLALDSGLFRCTHGDFANPAAFNYIIDAPDALPSWRAVPHALLFVGHTHLPRIFVLGASGQPHAVEPQDFELEPGKRFIVSVGSVGQPRDGDTRSSYCILDTERRTVCWRRIPFDLDAYRAAFESAGLPAGAAGFLRHDPRNGIPPLRDQLNFSPARTAEQEARGTVGVREIEGLRRNVRRWQALGASALLLAAAALSGAGWFAWRHYTRALELDARQTPGASETAGVHGNALPPLPAETALNAPVAGWRVQLGNRRRQSAQVITRAGERMLELRSGVARDPVRIDTIRVTGKAGERFAMEALFEKADGFAGSIALIATVERNAGEGDPIERYRVKEPGLKRKGGWLKAQETFDLPAGSRWVTLRLHGSFTGTVRVKDIVLARRE